MRGSYFRAVAITLGVFMVLSGLLLLSPLFDGLLNKVNGIVALVFAGFVLRYAFGRKISR